MKEETGPFDIGNAEWWQDVGYFFEGLIMILVGLFAGLLPLLFFL